MASLTPSYHSTLTTDIQKAPANQTNANSRPTSLQSQPSKEMDEGNNKTGPVEQEPYENEFLTGPKLYMALSGATLACFLVLLAASIIATAIPQITTEFHSLLDVGWYRSAYQLTSSAFKPFSGKVYAHFSTKWSFLTFFFLFELVSISSIIIYIWSFTCSVDFLVRQYTFVNFESLAPLPRQTLLVTSESPFQPCRYRI